MSELSKRDLHFYNNLIAPVYDDDLPIEVLGSSSSGNSIYFKPFRTIVDIGFSKNHYPDDMLYQTSYVALTHEHTDHLNIITFDYLYHETPWIKFFVTKRLYAILENMSQEKRHFKPNLDSGRFVFTDDTKNNPLLINDLPNGNQFYVRTLTTDHGDIINVAYDFKAGDEVYFGRFRAPRILYSSDLQTTGLSRGCDGLPMEKCSQFDIIFLEANYDENDVKSALNADPYDIKAQNNLRHISEQESFAYVQRHLKENGLFMPLHASRVFGTYQQNATI